MSGSKAYQQLLLTSDYRAPAPVWINDYTVLSDLSLLGISPQLEQSLVAWQQYFDEHSR
jgi:hypothetical protein